MKKYLSLILGFGSFFLLPSVIPELARTAPIETSATVITELPIERLRKIAEAITVKVQVGDTSGSGTIIKQQGQVYTILTNAHVASRGDSYTIQTPDGETHTATLKATGDSFNTDLAFLEFFSPNAYDVASLNLSPNLSSEQTVYLAGFPYNQSNLTFTDGNISLISTQPFKGGYQIGFTNQTKQGMSGGALLDKDGKVIGIFGLGKSAILNTAYTYQDGTMPEDITLQRIRQANFAVPIDSIEKIQPKKSLPKNIANNSNSSYQTPYTGLVGKVDTIAQQITVKIDNLTENSNGSGVIVAHQNDTYYVLTAKHVLCLPESKTECVSNGQNQIVTPDGKTYIIDPQTVKIPADWLDVAIVKFKSGETYQVATLGSYELKSQWIFTSGFPINKDGSEPQRILTGGTVFEKERTDFSVKDAYSLEDGQGLVYTNISYAGMSGGAVLDSTGRVVGINNSVEGITEITEQGIFNTLNLGYSLGVPITHFIGSADKVDIQHKWLEIKKNIASEMDSNEVENIKQQLLVTQKPSKDANYIDWMNYGNQLWRYTNHQEAIEAFKKTILLKDNFHEAYYGIGLAYYDLGEYKQAISNFQKATKLQPNIAYYWRWLGSSYDSFASDTEVSLMIENSLEFFANASLKEKILKFYTEALFAYNKAIDIEQNLVFYIERGDVLSNLEKYSEAIDSYNKSLAIKLHPRTYKNRANTYERLEQYQNALADYNQALQLEPKNPWTYISRADTYIELEQYDEALADYQRAISLEPKNVSTYISRADTYIELEQYDEALADYQRAISLEPKNVSTYIFRARTYINLKQYDKAFADYERAIQLEPKDPFIYTFRADTYIDLKQYDKAFADYERAIQLNPKNVSTYISRADTYIELEQYDEALADYERAISLEPKNVSTYISRADTYIELEQYDEALADYERAISLNPQDPWSYNNRGNAYFKLEKYDEALADYNQLIKLNPKDAIAYTIRGNTYIKLEQYNKALADYNQAIQLEPKNLIAYTIRANTYFNLEQYDEALADYNQVLQLNPKNAIAYNNRGNTYFNLKQYDEALADYNQAIQLNPKNAIAYTNRGNTYWRLEQHDKAISDYQQALNINPNYFLALNNLGLITYEQQQTAKAVEYWQQVLQRAPETEETILALSVAMYRQGETAKAVEMATKVLSANQQWSGLNFLREQLWGDNLIKDTQVLFKDERLQPLIP